MEELENMPFEKLWELFPIILREHNPNYSTLYREEEHSLTQALSSYNVSRISHIGSTSVKGLIAKPIVDILLELPTDYEMSEITKVLRRHEWLVMAQDEKKKTIDLNKGYTQKGFAKRVFHLHVKPEGDWGELYFKDYLQQNPDIARRYESLKVELSKRFEHNRDAYTEAKTDFILKHTDIARNEFPDRYSLS